MRRLALGLVLAALLAAASAAEEVAVPTSVGRGADATLGFGDPNANAGAASKLYAKHGPHAAGNRKTVLRFDLSEAKAKAGDLTAARLDLDIETTNAGLISPWTFRVYGLRESADYGGDLGEDWAEDQITWSNAPGNSTAQAGAMDPQFTVLLGTMQAPQRRRAMMSFTGPELVKFLREDTNGLVTLYVVRESKHDNVFAWASKEEGRRAAPTLVLNPAAPAAGGDAPPPPPPSAPTPAPAPDAPPAPQGAAPGAAMSPAVPPTTASPITASPTAASSTAAPSTAASAPVASEPPRSTAQVKHPEAPGPRAFPDDAGLVNVRDFGARGDGVTDDTAALQAALNSVPSGNRIVYLPAGTYLVSDTLTWPRGAHEGQSMKRTILEGQDRATTILRLQDHCSGFQDARQPRPVLLTGHKPAQRFRNAVRQLTIDTGKGNPAAIGARYMANNQGTFRDTTIRSGDGQGAIGLDLGFDGEQGPCLIHSVRVEGFDLGLRTCSGVNSITIENLELHHQRVAGLQNNDQVISIRGLRSVNRAPAVVNQGGSGLMTLLDADLRFDPAAPTADPAAPAAPAAVLNAAALFARNLTTTGYPAALADRAGIPLVPDAAVAEWTSHPPLTALAGPTPRSLQLPVRETPTPRWDPLDQWVNPADFGANPADDRDDAPAVQAAIDSGKGTLYFPGLPPDQQWLIDSEVVVRGNVHRIIGCEGRLRGSGSFRIAQGTSPVVRFERIDGIYAPFALIHDARTLVVSSVSDVSIQSGAAPGDLFLEDVVTGALTLRPGQHLFARQLNIEATTTKLRNDRGLLWVLGYKTERAGSLLHATGGASELLGIFCYSNKPWHDTPVFLLEDAPTSLTMGESCFIKEGPARVLVAESTAGQSGALVKGQAPHRSGGSMIVLYRSAATPAPR